MRLEELVLRIPGEDFRIRFHEHLTVLAGVGLLERQALAESFLGALVGNGHEATLLTYRDRAGRPVELVCEDGLVHARYLDDGRLAPAPIGSLVPDAESLRALSLIHSNDIGLSASTAARADDPPELAEARSMLATLTNELEAALAEHQGLERAREELAETELQIRQIHDDAARRDYARTLAELERVRAEAAAMQGGAAGAENDHNLLESAAEGERLAAAWQEASARLAQLVHRFGERDRLDQTIVDALQTAPSEIPSRLHALVEHWQRTKAERDHLDARIRELATSKLPEPSDPNVLKLATVDQEALWTTHDRVMETARSRQREQIALGGVAADDSATSVAVSDVEAAHREVEDAQALLDERRIPCLAGGLVATIIALFVSSASPLLGLLPLLAALAGVVVGLGVPNQRLDRARRVEALALQQVGAPTYLGFHLRRVDAVTRPGARDRLEQAAVDHRTALMRWTELVGDVDPEAATRLETEVQTYASRLAGLGDAAGELEGLRRQLVDRAEPAAIAARQAVVELAAPWALTDHEIGGDPAAFERQLTGLVTLGHLARLQGELEEAEAQEAKLGDRLDDLLHRLAFREGTLEARVGALRWAVEGAAEREEARAKARPRPAIEADLQRLQAEVRRLRRPEWAEVTASDANGPSLAELETHRKELHASIAADPASQIDLERLADRHGAIERRVGSLEAAAYGHDAEVSIDQLADVHEMLLGRLTRATHVGPDDDAVPVILDDTFVRVPAERKWELLDMLLRLSERTQLIYLTDDPFVGAWARQRALDGDLALLEPVEESLSL